MTDEERFNRLAAALMGKCWHESDIQEFYDDLHMVPRCSKCKAYFTGQFSAIYEGKIAEFFRDWMQDNMWPIWNKYIEWIWKKNTPDRKRLLEVYNYANLLHYLEDHHEWAWEDCPECHGTGTRPTNLPGIINPLPSGGLRPCYNPDCHGGKVIIEKYREALKILEEK
jgi:hypothetical protein